MGCEFELFEGKVYIRRRSYRLKMNLKNSVVETVIYLFIFFWYINWIWQLVFSRYSGKIFHYYIIGFCLSRASTTIYALVCDRNVE